MSNRTGHAAAVVAHLETGRKHRRAVPVHRRGADVTRGVLRVKAARHQMDVHRGHIAGHRKVGIEPQRPRTAPASDCGGFGGNLLGVALDLRLHRPPGLFLSGVAQCAPRLEKTIVQHGPTDVGARLRCPPVLLAKLRFDRVVVVTAHLLGEIDHDALSQRRDETLACGLVMGGPGERIDARWTLSSAAVGGSAV